MSRPSLVVESVSEKLFLQVSLCYPTVASKSMDALAVTLTVSTEAHKHAVSKRYNMKGKGVKTNPQFCPQLIPVPTEKFPSKFGCWFHLAG